MAADVVIVVVVLLPPLVVYFICASLGIKGDRRTTKLTNQMLGISQPLADQFHLL